MVIDFIQCGQLTPLPFFRLFHLGSSDRDTRRGGTHRSAQYARSCFRIPLLYQDGCAAACAMTMPETGQPLLVIIKVVVGKRGDGQVAMPAVMNRTMGAYAL